MEIQIENKIYVISSYISFSNFWKERQDFLISSMSLSIEPHELEKNAHGS